MGLVHAVCAAPGTGKSSLLPELVSGAPQLVVLDLDELPDSGSILGVPVLGPSGSRNWAAYDMLWHKILALVTRGGQQALILCQIPNLAEPLPTRSPLGTPIRWYLLDCADDVRERRLRARGWSPDRIAELTTAVEVSRTVFRRVVRVGDGDTAAAASARVLDAIRLDRLRGD